MNEMTCDALTVVSTTAPAVYAALDEHQRALDLDHRQKLMAGGFSLDTWLKELQRWREIFAVEFKLRLPPVAFCVKHTRSNCYGYFRPGHNEFGLAREIAINRRYLSQREPWLVLGTLLHELLHAWQDLCGKAGTRNCHNAEFREKAAGYGLIVDSRGVTEYAPSSPFMDLLKKYSVTVPEQVEQVVSLPAAGGSKLKKWSCGCTNVRVAVAHFRALCLNCHQEFMPQQ